jgi:outer membrane protein TolC
VEVVPDPDASARLAVPPAALQLSLAAGSRSGVTVGTIWEGDYPVRVVLGEDPRQPATIEDLKQQYVSSALLMATVPLEEIASIRPAWSDGTILHRNGVPTVTVRVDVGRDVVSSTVQAEVERLVAALGEVPGVRIEYGGEMEMRLEMFGYLMRALGTSVVAIYLILLFQFRRHRKALLVMLTMPLSLLGALVGLQVTGYPFGFTAFVGVISLMGMVVRSGIILVDYAEHLQVDQGLSGKDAGFAAGKRRMRPVFLTSAAAAVGVVPLILSGSTLWAPLGTVICFGLIFSMVLTLFVLPVAYWKVADTPGGYPGVRAPGAVVAGLLMLVFVAVPASAQEAPLTLEQCRELTLKHNAEIRSTDLSVAEAEAMSQVARTKYFPQISAGATALAAASPMAEVATHSGNLSVFDGSTRTALTAFLPAGSMAMAQNGYAVNLTAVQPLYAGGRISNGNRLASLGIDVARENGTIARRDSLALTEEKYWRVVELTEKQHTLDAYDALLKALEAQARDAVDAGLATPNDLLKVTVQRKKVDVDRMRLESGIRLSARDLRRHIGLSDGDTISLADTLAPPQDPTVLKGEKEGGFERRPEIRQLERAVRAEQLQAEVKRGEMLPTVSVGAVALHYDFSGLERINNVAVLGTVSIPISARREVGQAIAALHAREQIAESRLDSSRRLIALDIEKRWDDLSVAWRAADVADAAIEQAELNLREARDRHAAGLSTVSDVLEPEVLLHQAQDHRIDARRDYWLARAAYLRAIGRDDLV